MKKTQATFQWNITVTEVGDSRRGTCHDAHGHGQRPQPPPFAKSFCNPPGQVSAPVLSVLNPIENCFSVLKADAKQRLAHMHEMVASPALARENEMGLVEWRTHCLIREVSRAVAAITPETVSTMYRKADSFLFRCLNGEVILH